MKIALWGKLLITIFLCFMMGYLGSVATMQTLDRWYMTLVKPSFNPPNWIFAPVWSFLYLTMGIAAGLIWHKGWHRREVSNSLMFFLLQLVLNGLWSTVFFGMQSIQGGLVIILLLFISIVMTTLKFWPIQKFAGILMIPYVLWVAFATVLNTALLFLN